MNLVRLRSTQADPTLAVLRMGRLAWGALSVEREAVGRENDTETCSASELPKDECPHCTGDLDGWQQAPGS